MSVQGAPDVNDLAQGNTAAQQKVTSYVAVVTSASVLAPVITELGLDETVEELAEHITAKSPANSVLIDISVTSSDPSVARATADAAARSFIRVVTDRLEKPIAGGSSLVRPEIIQPATTPTQPTSPNAVVDAVLGAIAGLALGIAAALLRHVLDTKVRSVGDLNAVSDLALLGNIALDPSIPDHPLVVHAEPLGAGAEAFRTLRTNVQFIGLDQSTRAMVITSALPSEGKSTTAANLAVSMAENGSRVVLVDADLRRPRIAELMEVEGAAGLTDVLIGRAELADVLLPWGRGGLHILPAGQIPPNPSELLGSYAMRQLIEVLSADFDAVIFDAPPLLPVTDAAVLSRMVGGAVLVTAVGRATRAQLRAAIQAISAAGASTLGFVRTKVPRKRSDAGAYGTYYAHSTTPTIAGTVTARAGRRVA